MLTLPELHYEDLAKKKSKKIYGSVAYAHRKALNQKLVLPQRVNDIMKSSRDEVSPPAEGGQAS